MKHPPPGRAYFLFQDLSIRQEGSYRLTFSLFEICAQEGAAVCRAQVLSDIMTVYSPKKFPGLDISSALMREIASQGGKVRIRREARIRNRRNSAVAKVSNIPSSTTNDRGIVSRSKSDGFIISGNGSESAEYASDPNPLVRGPGVTPNPGGDYSRYFSNYPGQMVDSNVLAQIHWLSSTAEAPMYPMHPMSAPRPDDSALMENARSSRRSSVAANETSIQGHLASHGRPPSVLQVPLPPPPPEPIPNSFQHAHQNMNSMPVPAYYMYSNDYQHQQPPAIQQSSYHNALSHQSRPLSDQDFAKDQNAARLSSLSAYKISNAGSDIESAESAQENLSNNQTFKEEPDLEMSDQGMDVQVAIPDTSQKEVIEVGSYPASDQRILPYQQAQLQADDNAAFIRQHRSLSLPESGISNLNLGVNMASPYGNPSQSQIAQSVPNSSSMNLTMPVATSVTHDYQTQHAHLQAQYSYTSAPFPTPTMFANTLPPQQTSFSSPANANSPNVVTCPSNSEIHMQASNYYYSRSNGSQQGALPHMLQQTIPSNLTQIYQHSQSHQRGPPPSNAIYRPVVNTPEVQVPMTQAGPNLSPDFYATQNHRIDRVSFHRGQPFTQQRPVPPGPFHQQQPQQNAQQNAQQGSQGQMLYGNFVDDEGYEG